MTIHELRKNGCKVRVLHWRYRLGDAPALRKNRPELLITNKEVKEGKRKVFPRGGKTVLEVLFPNSKSAKSETLCSVTDGFSYKRGVAICLQRLKKEIQNNLNNQQIRQKEGKPPKNFVISPEYQNEFEKKLVEKNRLLLQILNDLLDECDYSKDHKTSFKVEWSAYRKAKEIVHLSAPIGT